MSNLMESSRMSTLQRLTDRGFGPAATVAASQTSSTKRSWGRSLMASRPKRAMSTCTDGRYPLKDDIFPPSG